jgi:hypothetical protein
VIRAHFSAQRSSSIQAQKFPSNPPPSIQPPPGFSILDVDALEMARQITIGDSSLFRAIQVRRRRQQRSLLPSFDGLH